MPGEPSFEEIFARGRGDLNPVPRRSQKSDTEEILTEVMKALENADQYIAAGEMVIGAAKPPLIKALGILLDTLADIRVELESKLERNSFLSAAALHRDYKNYLDVGFTKDQAFKLVLAAIKPINFGELLGQAANRKASKKNE